ncbi:hypothetical protein COHAPHLL_00118 [Vibrio phage V09]|uniref:Uncharacterized protein n=1 Tax=Vibrio phage V09 TaxID=2724327 RepID=A0A6H0X998_9CAUD|nr:hypothetical protein COHAPHLL_00118 [Vibrio phage V09]
MTDKKQKPTLIFDVDGVLIDWASQLPLFCKRCGIDPVRALKHFTAKEHVDVRDLFGVEQRSIAFDLLEKYNLEHGKYMTAFPDAVEHVHKIAKEYNLVALTKFGDTTDHWLVRKFNIETFFPGCFSELITIRGDESKVGYVAALQADHNVVGFIDDQLENIQAIGRATNLKTIHLNRYDERADVHHMSKLLDFLHEKV